jgi:hypothetical protein
MDMQDRITIVMDEYRALRAEVIRTKASRIAILNLGFATLGVFVLATAQLLGASGLIGRVSEPAPGASNTFLPFCMLAFILPGWCILLLVLSTAEEERMRRVGRYLSRLEGKVNAMARRGLLGWEHWLVHDGQHFGYSSIVVMAALVAMASGSLSLACRLAFWNPLRMTWFCLMAAVVLSTAGWAFRRYVKMMRKLREAAPAPERPARFEVAPTTVVPTESTAEQDVAKKEAAATGEPPPDVSQP